MFDALIAWVVSLSSLLSLELFALVSSFLEEILAPIPSPLVGTLLGSLALASGYGSPLFIVWLGALAALGKTIACLVIYGVVARVGTVAVERFGGHFGVHHADIIAVSSYFTGSFRDYCVLIAARAIPFIPSLPISLAAGLLKTPLRFYLTATFIGTFIRDTLFIVIGYYGLSAYLTYTESFASLEWIVLLSFGFVCVGLLIGLYFAQVKKGR